MALPSSGCSFLVPTRKAKCRAAERFSPMTPSPPAGCCTSPTGPGSVGRTARAAARTPAAAQSPPPPASVPAAPREPARVWMRRQWRSLIALALACVSCSLRKAARRSVRPRPGRYPIAAIVRTEPRFIADAPQEVRFHLSRGAAEAKSQIYVMHADGGEASKLTDSKENISSYSWSPDSTRIAFMSNHTEDPDRDPADDRRDPV